MDAGSRQASANPPRDNTAESDEVRWRDFGRGYAKFAGALGIPCLVLSLWLRDSAFILGWLQAVLMLPVLVGIVAMLWLITLAPILFLVGAVVGRCEKPKNFRRDRPGIIVCP